MRTRNIFIMLMLALAALCSCSTSEDFGDLNFSIKDRCKDRPVQALSKSDNEIHETVSNDTVYFEKRNNGQVFANIEIPVSCGDVKFSLYSDMNNDTLFIDAKTKGDASTSCSCMAEVEVDIPNDMQSVKYLVLQRKRSFVKTVIFKE